MQRTPTRLHRLIERDLGEPLADFVSERRERETGWRAIASEIQLRTGIEVSHQALRDWFSDEPTAEPTLGGAR